MRKALLVIATCAALLAGPGLPTAKALPHGCASMNRDFQAAFEPRARDLGVTVHVDEPCTFIYNEGDTFSGSGRFTVACDTGGYYHHKDVHDGGEWTNLPVAMVPIPQPCDLGAVVTVDGYRTGTGGAVIAGGLGSPPAAPEPIAEPDAFHALCAPGTAPAATVDLRDPVNYSGLLTYTGEVTCIDATVEITSLTATPYGDYPNPSAGSTRCKNCRRSVSLSGTLPAETWIFEVTMDFTVSKPGKPAVHGRRIGRYAASWAGNVTTLCPGVRPVSPANDPEGQYIPAGETCPA